VGYSPSSHSHTPSRTWKAADVSVTGPNSHSHQTRDIHHWQVSVDLGGMHYNGTGIGVGIGCVCDMWVSAKHSLSQHEWKCVPDLMECAELEDVWQRSRYLILMM